MRVLVKILGIFIIVTSCFYALSDEYFDYKYREYCEIIPTEITVEREVDGKELLELIVDGGEIDTADNNYYLASAVLENKTRVDGYFWAFTAFTQGRYSYSCNVRMTAQTEREQDISEGWFIPAGESITAHFILETSEDSQTVSSRANPELVVQLPGKEANIG